MGRPLAKKFFSHGAGHQVAITAKIGSNAEGAGFIVKQTGSSRYIVTVGSHTGVVYLVDGTVGSLGADEAVILMKDETGTEKTVKKLMSHRVVFFDGTSAPWSFDPAVDPYEEVADVDDGYAAAITITAQPSNATVTGSAASTFTVSASVTPSETLSYQWQHDAGSGFTNLTNSGVYSTVTTATLHISDSTGLNGHHYRVVVSATGATPVTSASATLTVN